MHWSRRMYLSIHFLFKSSRQETTGSRLRNLEDATGVIGGGFHSGFNAGTSVFSA
jgi:hypothetical protein